MTVLYYDEGEKMIIIFPMLVSKNVNTNLVQGLAITLEQYIASYAISDFIGKAKEFNKYYNYKIKGGKIFGETESTWFDLDPVTRSILDEQDSLSEVIYDAYGNPVNFPKGAKKKGNRKNAPPKDPTQKAEDWTSQATKAVNVVQGIDKAIKDIRANKDPEKGDNQPLEKPTFTKADIINRSMNLEPTWVKVHTKDNVERRLGIKVIPMMIEGFNIKHAVSADMGKYFLNTFIAGIGRLIMRKMYSIVDKWTMYGNRPRGDIRHDVFYARTGHDGQPFILLDKNEDIPSLFFSQPQNILKLWRLSWGNIIIADDVQKMVMFCMKKYKGMCSNFSYSMIYSQNQEMARVFDDMEDARKATSSLFKFNKKITSIGGK